MVRYGCNIASCYTKLIKDKDLLNREIKYNIYDMCRDSWLLQLLNYNGHN
jgi:hypothetical protein